MTVIVICGRLYELLRVRVFYLGCRMSSMSGSSSQEGSATDEHRPGSGVSATLLASAEDSLSALNLSRTPSRRRSANVCRNYELMPEVGEQNARSANVTQSVDDGQSADATPLPGPVLKPLPLAQGDGGRSVGARKFAKFWRFLTKKRGHSRRAGSEADERAEGAGGSSCLCSGLKRSCHPKAAFSQTDDNAALMSSLDPVSKADVGVMPECAASGEAAHLPGGDVDDVLMEWDWSFRFAVRDESDELRSGASLARQSCRAPADLLPARSSVSSPLDDSPTSQPGGLLQRGASTASSSSSSSGASFGTTSAATAAALSVSQRASLPARVETLDRGRLVSTTTYPSGGVEGRRGVCGSGGGADESVPTLVPRTIHTQIDYMHCLVPELQRIAACAYYWGVMDRYEAERALEGRPEGTFLLRDSAQDDFLFSVSFRRYGRSLHARVEQWNHRFSFDSHDATVFSSPSVCALVEHYKDPASCLFFEPLLTAPLPRTSPFSLQALCRTAVCATTTYDGISALPLPAALKTYLQYYHYKQKVRVRRFEAPPPPPPMRPLPTRPLPSIPGASTP